MGGTKYWLVVTETIGDWNWLVDDVGPPLGPAGEGDPVSEIGATFDGYQFKNADDPITGPDPWGGSSWNNPVEVTAIPNAVPEPSSSLLALLGTSVLLLRRKRE